MHRPTWKYENHVQKDNRICLFTVLIFENKILLPLPHRHKRYNRKSAELITCPAQRHRFESWVYPIFFIITVHFAPYQLFVLFCQSVLCAGQKRNGEKIFFCWWRNHYIKRDAPNPPVKNTASSSSTLPRIMTFHDVYIPSLRTSLPPPFLVKSADRSGRNKRSPDYTDYVFKWCYNGGCGF